jgi:hypothetical protein
MKPSYPNRRTLIAAGLAVLAPAWATAQRSTPIEVWKSPTCGCCHDWIAHLEAAGFEVVAHDTGNTAMRMRLGVAPRYGSCHTARVAGYAIEGHVPAADICRLLRERPAALGLAVPGMPIGSPGMDGPAYGHRKDPYDVLLLDRQGGHTVFQHHA